MMAAQSLDSAQITAPDPAPNSRLIDIELTRHVGHMQKSLSRGKFSASVG